MAAHVPRHALTLMASSAKLATKHGLKKGLSTIPAKANPALLVIEAAVSILEAVDSCLKLKTAKERRRGLENTLPLEEGRLRTQRQQLAEQLHLAKEEVAQKMDIQKRLGQLVYVCGQALNEAFSELHTNRSSDLPDPEAFGSQLLSLESAWANLLRASQNFQETST